MNRIIIGFIVLYFLLSKSVISLYRAVFCSWYSVIAACNFFSFYSIIKYEQMCYSLNELIIVLVDNRVESLHLGLDLFVLVDLPQLVVVVTEFVE